MESRKRILWERSPGTNWSFRKWAAIFTVPGQCRSQLSTQRTLSFCLWHVTKAKWIHFEHLTDGFLTELQIQTYTWWISLLPQSTRRIQGPEISFVLFSRHTRALWKEKMGAELCFISPSSSFLSSWAVCIHAGHRPKEVRCLRLIQSCALLGVRGESGLRQWKSGGDGCVLFPVKISFPASSYYWTYHHADCHRIPQAKGNPGVYCSILIQNKKEKR